MVLICRFNTFLIFLSLVSGGFLLPNVPNLPTPQLFLETLFNCTETQLVRIVKKFSFNNILSEHITFLLYKPDGSIITLDSKSRHHNIKRNEPIKFIIHGWRSSGDADFVKNFAESYHSIGINNVYAVDWSSHSKTINYLHSAHGTRKVGEIVGQFVMNVINNNTKFLKNVHLVGHSLGAQVSGFAGKHIQKLTNGKKIGRITGLDAAAPLFEFPIHLKADSRINKNDASYVDGIHTNAGFLGFAKSFADADYFVDFGGPIQTGCYDVNFFNAFICSHGKAHTIYNRTITTKQYKATSCSSSLLAASGSCNRKEKVVMGEHTKIGTKGSFFINIDEEVLPVNGNLGVSHKFNRLPGLG